MISVLGLIIKDAPAIHVSTIATLALQKVFMLRRGRHVGGHNQRFVISFLCHVHHATVLWIFRDWLQTI